MVDNAFLMRKMKESLTQDDLNKLCQVLNVADTNLNEQNLLGKIRTLVQIMQDSGRIPELLSALTWLQPNEFSFLYAKDIVGRSDILKGSGGRVQPDPSLIEIPPISEVNGRVVNIESQISDPQAKILLERAIKLTDRVIKLTNFSAQKQAMEQLDQAKKLLRTNKDKVEDWPLHLSNAENLLDIVDALLYREERIIDIRRASVRAEEEYEAQKKADEQRLNWIVPIVALIYISLLTVLVIVTYKITGVDYKIPILDIPISIVAWSGIGGLCALLYRYYKRQRVASPIIEARLMLARPIIGIFFGAIVYLALRTGIYVLSGQGQNTDLESPPLSQHHALVVLAWLVSFSDYVFERVIVKLAGNLTGQESEKTFLSVSQVEPTQIAAIEERTANNLLKELRKLIAEQSDRWETELPKTMEDAKNLLMTKATDQLSVEDKPSKIITDSVKNLPDAPSQISESKQVTPNKIENDKIA